METGLNRSVVLENDALRVQVYPQIGGKVASIVDKADGYELLFNFPDEIPTQHAYDTPYAEHWFAGWDECFPSVAPSPYVGHPYDGILSPDHGELWGLPTTAVPTKDGITTVWHGLRFGYRFVRKLYLEQAAIIAKYTLVNLSPFTFRYVWAMHSLLSAKSPVQIELGNVPMRASRRLDDAGHSDFNWPMWSEGVDLSQPSQLPADHAWKAFTEQPIAAPAVIRYLSRNRTVTLTYQSNDQPAHWGVWVNNGSWMHHHLIAIEPTTGRSDELDRAIRDGSAGQVDGGGTAEWTVQMAVG